MDWTKKALEMNKKGHLRSDQQDGSKDLEKMIRMSLIHEHGYDLRAKMGTILLKEKKVEFESFENIQRAYVATFGEEAKQLFEASKYQEMKALQAVRNLFAHRGGVCDEKFKAKMAKHRRFGGV